MKRYIIPCGVAIMVFTLTVMASDYDDYLASIREQGMTDYAKVNLDSIVSILTEDTLLTFPKNANGYYGSMCRGNRALLPKGADLEVLQKAEEELKEKNQKNLAYLKPLADTDSSGFITSEEANDFRYLIENGLKIHHLLVDESLSIEDTCKQMGLIHDELINMAVRYNGMVSRLASHFPLTLNELDLPQPGETTK